MVKDCINGFDKRWNAHAEQIKNCIFSGALSLELVQLSLTQDIDKFTAEALLLAVGFWY